MSKFGRFALVDWHPQWLTEGPDAVELRTAEVSLHVRVQECGEENNERERASLLEDIAERGPFRGIDEPVEWQRQFRGEPDSALDLGGKNQGSS